MAQTEIGTRPTLKEYARGLLSDDWEGTSQEELMNRLKTMRATDKETFSKLRLAGVSMMRQQVFDTITRTAKEDDEEIGKDCPICGDVFAAGASIASVEGCGHAFCAGCLATWANTNKNSCPMCRKALSTSGLFLHKQAVAA
jgi:Ring finger domain